LPPSAPPPALGAITYAFDVRPEVAEQIESMGAEFVYPRLRGRAAGRRRHRRLCRARQSEEFREKQLEKFRELAPDMDIVITTALIPNRPAPKLWTEGHGRGHEARLGDRRPGGRTRRQLRPDRMDEKIVTDNGVTIIGYTDFPSRAWPRNPPRSTPPTSAT
jgi:NAD(P) transhydrogenase subunit alpha